MSVEVNADDRLYSDWKLTHPVDLGYACIVCEGAEGELKKAKGARAWRYHESCIDNTEGFMDEA